MNKRQLIWVILLFSQSSLYAQQYISLEQAFQIALQNNGLLQSQELNSLHKKQLINTAKTVPASSFQLEAGQLNSAYVDHKIGISQSFYAPGVIKSGKKLLQQEYELSKYQKSITEYDVIGLIRNTFIQFLYLEEKEKLLLSTQHIYDSFLLKAQMRLKAGESNLLEVTTAQSQKEQISLQLTQAKTDKSIALQQLQLALQSKDIVVPMGNLYDLKYTQPDTTSIMQHPLLTVLEQQHKVAVAATDVEKSRLLPEFNAGLNSMTIRGTGADNKLYNAAQRFQWVQAGVAIPIFKAAQKEKIKAAKLYEGLVTSQYNQEALSIRAAYKQAIAHYQNAIEIVQYYQSTGLSTAATIKITAGKQFSNGEINYLEWVLVIEQALRIETGYLDATKAAQDALTRITYFKQN